MDEDQGENKNRDPSDSSESEKKEIFIGFQDTLEEEGASASPSTTTLCDKTVSPESLQQKPEWMPSFNSYEDFIQKTLKSLDGFMIILNTEGVILFVPSRVFLLLGHISEEIMGKTLLSLLPESEKSRVYQKIALKFPFSSAVGKHIKFGCHLRRGNVDYSCNPVYEYAKIILNVIDISEEPLILFTQLFSRHPLKIPIPVEDRFYLVGLVCVIKSQTFQELCSAEEGGDETEEDTDDEGPVDYSFRRVTYHGSTYKGITYETEDLYAGPEHCPLDDQASTVTVEQYGSRNSSSECNIESASSPGSRSSSPEPSASWNALTCFQNFSFNLDHNSQMMQNTSTVPSYKYCVVETQDNPSVEKLVPVEVVEGGETEEKQVEEEPIQKEEQQVKGESVAEADGAEPVQEVKPEEAAELEAAEEARVEDPGEESKPAMKAEPIEESTGKAEPAEEVKPGKEGKVAPVKVEKAVKMAKEALEAADFAEKAEVAEGVEEKLENLKEAELSPEVMETELETLPCFSVTTVSQALVPARASRATTTLAIEGTMGLLQADTKHSQETREETAKQLKTVLDPESQHSTSVPCKSPGSQSLEALTKHTGKLKRSHSDVFKAKRFRASPLPELEKPCDPSIQVQPPKEGAQDPPGPSTAQEPAEVPEDGAQLSSSGDEQLIQSKP
ncbi:circadian clock protein PASD1 isoform X2 [Sorex araneus]|uniref:circadian clock protein PASD1 isoform X2 n=1 Tax=Sorex araneus TaxID=42254 RepID=UPI002433B05C|nr:circadian clock protein PASD1 isoform X2 [Sorex araneus]